MATKNRIKLTKNFQNICLLIEDYDSDKTYRLQIQSTAQVELVESEDQPTVLSNGALSSTDGRVVCNPQTIVKFKKNGTANLWARAVYDGNNYISAWEAE